MANLSNLNNKLIVTDEGHLLINQTANNNYRLQMDGLDGTVYAWFKSNVATTGARIGLNSDDFRVYNQQAGGNLSLGTVGTERIRITSDANVTFAKGSDTNRDANSIKHASNDFLYMRGGAAGIVIADNGEDTRMIMFDNGNVRFDAGTKDNAMIIEGSTGNTTIAGSITAAVNSFKCELDGSANVLLDLSSTGSQQIRFFDTDSSYTEAMRIYRFNDKLSITYGDNANEEALTVVGTGSTAGNVGIGTTSPGTYKLNVAGTGLFTGGLEMAAGGAVYQGQKFWLDGGGDTFLESPSSNIMTFTTGGTEKMRIVGTGAVGIDNSSPDSFSGGGSTTASLVIGKGTSGVSPHITLWQGNSAQAAISFASANTGAGQYEGRIRYTRDTGIMDFRTNGIANVLVLNASGNVGIGTTSPGRGLTIDKSNANAALEIIKNNTTNQIVYLGTGSSGVTDDPLLRMFHNGTENIRLYTTGDSWINGGNVGIGTTSPTAPLTIQANFTLNGGYTNSNWAKYIFIDSANTGGGGIIWTKQSSAYNRAIVNNQGKMEFGRSTSDSASAAWLSDLSIDAVGDTTFGGNIFIASTSDGIFLGGTGSTSVLKKFVGNQGGGGAVWTPTVTTSQGTSPTITSSSGYYQQIGNVVTVSFEFTMSNPTVGAGSVIINNLPIAIADADHVSGCGVIGDLGKTINVRHYTATNQIAMNFYDGNYCGTAFRTVGTVTYWAAT